MSSSEGEEPFQFASYQPRRPKESQESQPSSSVDQSQSNYVQASEPQRGKNVEEQEDEQEQEEEWNPSTPSIHSADSGELHETRPNRWRGHPSTWKTWTKNERRVWQGLEGTRKKDLGVHLFNVWGVRKGYRETPRDVSVLFKFFFPL